MAVKIINAEQAEQLTAKKTRAVVANQHKAEMQRNYAKNSGTSGSDVDPEGLLSAKERAKVLEMIKLAKEGAIENQEWVKKLPLDRQIYLVFGYYMAKNMNQIHKKALDENAQYWR